MYFVKAGFRTLSLEHLALIEDGAEDPAHVIPEHVVRATITGGRTLDFEGPAAECIRKYLEGVTLKQPPRTPRGDLHGHCADAGGGSPDAEAQA